MSTQDAVALIEEIITCVNAFVLAPPRLRSARKNKANDIYIYAYKELASYLKHLFIYYDKKIDPIPDSIETWAWSKFLTFVANSGDYERVTIATYNYDVWLERLLTKLTIPFNVKLIGLQIDAKINILKPHGSISFTHKKLLDKTAFEIAYDHELLDGAAEDFEVRYDNLPANYLVSALIPPAGESGRFNHTWAGQIREAAKTSVSSLSETDEVLVCGLSYWHVDRAELDEILVNCDASVNLKMINPQPLRTLNAVMTSIFNNFISYSSASILEDFIS